MAHWRCIAGCGACCRLDPQQRAEDLACLAADQRRSYLAMVGEDGWCIHFDSGARRCRIYDSRPDFCRVENLMALFARSAGPSPAQQPQIAAGTAAPAATEAAACGAAATPATQAPMDAAAQALAIASCRTQIRAEYGGRGRVMRRFERAIRRQP